MRKNTIIDLIGIILFMSGFSLTAGYTLIFSYKHPILLYSGITLIALSLVIGVFSTLLSLGSSKRKHRKKFRKKKIYVPQPRKEMKLITELDGYEKTEALADREDSDKQKLKDIEYQVYTVIPKTYKKRNKKK